jgi:hypothetical protein
MDDTRLAISNDQFRVRFPYCSLPCINLLSRRASTVDHDLKDDLIFLPDAYAAIEQWLSSVLQALKGSFVEQDENCLFRYILQRLYQTRDELPGLILPASQN